MADPRHSEATFASSGDSMIDAYRIEIKRLTERLTWIADPSYVGNYSDAEVVEIYRKWAKEALA